MQILAIILNNKRWTMIIILLLYSVWQTAQVNSLGGDIKKLKVECQDKVKTEVAKAVKPYEQAIAKAQDKANQASADYEQLKSEQLVKNEVVIKEVQKIIDRPVYRNTCIDDDGLRQLNSLIPKNTS